MACVTRISALFLRSYQGRTVLRFRSLRGVALGVILGLTFVAGCESELETGYKPRPLNASSTDRRSYYAPPFTAEASAPRDEKALPSEGVRRPGNY